jgi:hypothetical protein
VRLRSVCRALLVLDIGYCLAAVFLPDLPGWKMFETAERAAYALHAGDGHAVDAYAWVPASARDLDDRDLAQIARWLCVGRREPLPLRLDTPGRHRLFDAPECAGREAP